MIDTRRQQVKGEAGNKLNGIFDVSYTRHHNADINDLRRALREAISPGSTLEPEMLSEGLDTKVMRMPETITVQSIHHDS